MAAAASSALPGLCRGTGLEAPETFGGPSPGKPREIVLPPTVIVSPAALLAVRRVSMRPYATVLARTPKTPHSLAIVLNNRNYDNDNEFFQSDPHSVVPLTLTCRSLLLFPLKTTHFQFSLQRNTRVKWNRRTAA